MVLAAGLSGHRPLAAAWLKMSISSARGERVQHLRDHADRDLIDGIAFELFPEAAEVDGVKPERPLGQFARREHVAFVCVQETGERF